MIEFAYPWAFAALPLPLLAWLLLPRLPLRGAVEVPVGIWQFLESVQGQSTGRESSLARLPVLQTIGWLALVIALAGPMIRGAPLIVPTGRELMIAVDVSASMAGSGDAAARATSIDGMLDRVAEFAGRREGDRVGLIAFGSEAHLIAPMTFDTGALGEMLREIRIGLAGRRTDLGQAIGLAIKVMRSDDERERVLAVISDGETNLGDLAALDAAALAVGEGITVHMIGFAEEIEPENAKHMADVAARTGGRFFHATEPVALAAALADLDVEEGNAARTDPVYLVQDWTWLPLSIALITLAAIGWREARDP